MLEISTMERDLGVLVSGKSNKSHGCAQRANRVLGCIRRSIRSGSQRMSPKTQGKCLGTRFLKEYRMHHSCANLVNSSNVYL